MGQGLSAANRRATQQANIDALDSLGSNRAGFTSILRPIENSVAEFVERVIKNINGEDMVVSGSIENISISTEGNAVKVYGPLHLIFQDKGVNGSVEKLYDTPFSYKDKVPPWQVFVDYIKTKNIQLRNEEKYTRKKNAGSPFAALEGDDKDIEKAARGMAYAVFRRGFRPRFIYSKELPKLLADIQKEVPGFLASQIAESFSQLPPQNINIKL
jgi:hypothetical protein